MSQVTDATAHRARQGRELAAARADRGRLPALARRAPGCERGRPAPRRRARRPRLRARDGGRDPALAPPRTLAAHAKVEALEYGDRKVYTVAAFNRGVATWLQRLPTVWVEGEVTELRRQARWADGLLHAQGPRRRRVPVGDDAARAVRRAAARPRRRRARPRLRPARALRAARRPPAAGALDRALRPRRSTSRRSSG